MIRFGALLLGFGLFFVTASQVQAQTTLSEAHTERIRQNCVSAQTTLDHILVHDAGLRVNRGRFYENISTKLMIPLNSRIVLNRLDGLDLAATTVEYDQQMDVFRATYQAYEKAMTRAKTMDCVGRPAEFHDSVATARELRKDVHDMIGTLDSLLQRYGAEFDAFVKENKDIE